MKQIVLGYKGDIDLYEQMSEFIREFKTGKYKNLLFHIYSGIYNEQILLDISKEIRRIFPDSLIAGTISAGEIKSGCLMDKGILISGLFFESTDVELIKYKNIKGNESEVGRKLTEKVNLTEDIKALELILPGTEFNTRYIFEELSKCKDGVSVFGGYAGGHDMENGEHFIFDDEEILSNDIFAILYSGKDFHIDVDKSVGWQTIGHHFVVTKADENRLIEIDNRPAVEIYEKYLQISRDGNFAEETFEFPLIVKVQDDELLRHTIAVEEDGTLDLAGYVTEGMSLYLCYGNPSLIVEKVNQRLKDVQDFCPEAILLYSCSVRKSFWENYVDLEMIPFNEIAPVAGFHTWGEVKRNPDTREVMEYNITLLSIAMREGDSQKKTEEYISVDDSVLEGQALLIKRLSQLVSATTTELQNAYRNLEKMNQKLKILSDHDALTGLFNRRKFEEEAIEEIKRAAYTSEVVSFVMLDIDYFKSINDEYGHDVGDSVLKEIAQIMKKSISDKSCSFAGRWGGEEFFISLPEIDADEAVSFTENLRLTVEGYEFSGVNKNITISLGVITTDGKEESSTIFKNVDDCLYAAKRNGRNCYIQYRR